jgi:hypothetical protein
MNELQPAEEESAHTHTPHTHTTGIIRNWYRTFAPLGENETQFLQAIGLEDTLEECQGRGWVEERTLHTTVQIESIVEGVVRVDVQQMLCIIFVQLQVLNESGTLFWCPNRHHDEWYSRLLQLVHTLAPLQDVLLTQGSPE